MGKPRIFLGSSGSQEDLALDDMTHVFARDVRTTDDVTAGPGQASQLDGKGEIRLESADLAAGTGATRRQGLPIAERSKDLANG